MLLNSKVRLAFLGLPFIYLRRFFQVRPCPHIMTTLLCFQAVLFLHTWSRLKRVHALLRDEEAIFFVLHITWHHWNILCGVDHRDILHVHWLFATFRATVRVLVSQWTLMRILHHTAVILPYWVLQANGWDTVPEVLAVLTQRCLVVLFSPWRSVCGCVR